MSPKKPKQPNLAGVWATLSDADGSLSLDSNDFPEPDLMSVTDPELSVQLGDFSAVWEYLNFNRLTLELSSTSGETERPASRKQLFKRGNAIKNVARAAVSSGSRACANASTKCEGRRTSNDLLKGKHLQTFAYRSPEEDHDYSPLYLSSYEPRRVSFKSPRRKSFLYVPPTFSSLSPLPKPAWIASANASASERRRSLFQKLLAKYPGEVDRILFAQSGSQSSSPYLSSLATLQPLDLHIFIDNSNILIGFYDAYKSKHKKRNLLFRPPKFDFHAFTTIVERGRHSFRRILVGSNPLTQPVPLAQQLGYEVSILERVVDATCNDVSTDTPYASDSATRTPHREKKKEQAVDEILHLKILECLLDVDKPTTIVLATGDAAPAEFSQDGGFLKCIQRALTRGWHVELVCWRKSMSRLWRDQAFRVEWKEAFSVIELDDYVDELVLE